MLIFVGWLPHDLPSSRSCLCLNSWIIPKDADVAGSRVLLSAGRPSHLFYNALASAGARCSFATCIPMAQMKPSASRATAVIATCAGLPRKTRR